MTVSPREQLPTLRGRQTQAAIDAAARAVIARKGILAATISDIAAEAGKSTASFYNYYDSKEAMVREWAVRFRDEARERSRAAAEPGLTNWERSYQAAAGHWNTYRNRLAEIISVSQLAMISDDFAEYWADICSLPIELITQMVKQAQRHGFCARETTRICLRSRWCRCSTSSATRNCPVTPQPTPSTTTRASPPWPTSSTGRSITRRPR